MGNADYIWQLESLPFKEQLKIIRQMAKQEQEKKEVKNESN